MTDVVQFLLDDCFWSPFDNGMAPEQTPLLTGFFQDHPLKEVLCGRFGIAPETADFEIEAARREVVL